MKKWGRGIDGFTIQRKMILIYILFGIIPMIAISIHTYVENKEYVSNQEKTDINSELERAAHNVTGRFEKFSTILNLVCMNQENYKYLNDNYENKENDELVYQMEDLFSGIMALYPEITQITVYSTNETLLKGSEYFSRIEEGMFWYDEVVDGTGEAVFQCVEKNGAAGYEIMLLKELNLHETVDAHHVLKLQISDNIFEQFLNNQREDVMQFVLDEEGTVIAGDKKEWISKNARDLYDSTRLSVTWGPVEPVGWMCAFVDNEIVGNQIRRNANRVFLLCIGLSTAAFICLYHYITMMLKRRIECMEQGMAVVGRGDLSYRIPELGTDEIGRIAVSINQMAEELELVIEESYKKELALRKAKLDLLQEQITPHFLYNTLSMISSMAVKAGNKKEAELIYCLSDFYRISLNQGQDFLTVREEIRVLESYLKIQNARFGNMIKTEYFVESEVMECSVLKLLLQPVIENAIIHGREEDVDILNIEIKIFQKDETLIFKITDDGMGMKKEQLYEVQEAINNDTGSLGLRNVNSRIRNYYGDAYGLYMESEYGFGTQVMIEIPFKQT